MEDDTLDEKSASDPSPEAVDPNEQGALGVDTTSPQSSKTGEKSLADFVSEKVKPSTDSPPEEGEKLDSKIEPDEQEKAPVEEKAKEGEEKEDLTKEEEKIVEGQPVPYERFKQVIDEREQVKRQVAEELQPQVENYQQIIGFCNKNNITAEQFEKVLRIQGLLNSDPAAALKEILPIVDALQGFVGRKLPEDLQEKVDSGKIEIDDAKELAQLRAKLQFGEKKSQYDRDTLARQQIVELRQKSQEASQVWIKAKRQADPDFKPKAKESDTDGLYEDTFDKFMSMLNKQNNDGQYANPCKTPQELVALMDKAYSLVKSKWTTRLTPKAPTRKTLSSNGSSGFQSNKTIEQASSLAEAVEIALARKGR